MQISIARRRPSRFAAAILAPMLLLGAAGCDGLTADLKPTVHFTFNTEGGNLFNNITRKNVSEDKAAGPEGSQKRRHLAIILDGMVMSAPTINSPIQTQGQISGNFTPASANDLAVRL